MPSTSIRKTEYDPGSKTLSVWFVASGKGYVFEDVPPETYAAFRAAFAKGRYFNDHIRNHFRYGDRYGIRSARVSSLQRRGL
ncbi:KTSC domain-containing protein [Mesorhizobium sp. M0114]|uniref:KTSC domain-containing protein n=1 Tax=unclassified Mesorhizobium TaxID=325217 RepID=UPI0033365F14